MCRSTSPRWILIWKFRIWSDSLYWWLGLSLALGLGTLLAPYAFLSAIAVAIIGALDTFLFGALRITGPAVIFFVLTFLMGTGMPVDPELTPIRVGLVFLGGAFSWIMGMIGWLNNPHEPEKIAVKKVYLELANFLELVGSDQLNKSKQKVIALLKTAKELLQLGYIPCHVTKTYKQLYKQRCIISRMPFKQVGRITLRIENPIR